MQYRVKNCICHTTVEGKIRIYCKLIANEMEDELNMILNTSLEHEYHMNQINENTFTCRWGYPFKNGSLILDNIFVFSAWYRDILL